MVNCQNTGNKQHVKIANQRSHNLLFTPNNPMSACADQSFAQTFTFFTLWITRLLVIVYRMKIFIKL